MDRRLRRELRALLNNFYGGTPDHEMTEVLDAIDEVIEEHGLVPGEPSDELIVENDD